jgi:5-methylcytosine-specific restriction protein A
MITKPRLRTLRPSVKAIDMRTAQPPAKVTDPFYTCAAWLALVAQVKLERGARCEDPLCKRHDRRASRIFGDHVVELQDGGAPLDPANVMLRCGSCHTRKTLAVRAARQRA